MPVAAGDGMEWDVMGFCAMRGHAERDQPRDSNLSGPDEIQLCPLLSLGPRSRCSMHDALCRAVPSALSIC